MFDLEAAPLAVPSWFEEEARALGVELEPGDAEKLGRFLGLMLSANERVNLTAITDPPDVWRKHALDALSLIQTLADLPDGALVADVGSGGGVPAVPLAICLPALRFFCIEATGKKAAFLTAAASRLGLANVRVINDRAEVIGQEVHGETGRARFDAVIARALGPLAVAAELCVPLAKVGGRIVLVKGAKAEQELEAGRRALSVLGAEHVETLETPTGRLIVLEKARPTPRTYPRQPGEPKRKPLQ